MVWPPVGHEGSPVPPSSRDRTAPQWMDKSDSFGEKRYLILRAADNSELPRNPWIISDSIKRVTGKVECGRPLDAQNTRILIETRSAASFTKMQTIKKLINDVPVVVEPHPTLNSVKFVFSSNSIGNMSNEEILEHLASDNVTDLYRFTKRVNDQIVQTNTFVATMNAVRVPEHILIGMERVPTRPYYPRPMRCGKCLRFGHTKKFCKGFEVCANCGLSAHGECQHESKCVNCSGPHNSFDKKCDHYLKEVEIIKIKVNRNISFKEARSIIALDKPKTLASIVQQRIEKPQSDPKDKIIEQLTNTVDKLQKQIESLTDTIKNLTSQNSSDGIKNFASKQISMAVDEELDSLDESSVHSDVSSYNPKNKRCAAFSPDEQKPPTKTPKEYKTKDETRRTKAKQRKSK